MKCGLTKGITAICLFLISLSWSIHQAYAVPPAPEVEAAGWDDIFIPRRAIPYQLLGINAFANDQRFGSIRAQYNEVRSTLRLSRVRILMHWNDGIQSSPTAQPFFGFYDELVDSLPNGIQAAIIMVGVPSWMNDSRNWIDGNPRKTFVEKWVKPVASRYGRNRRVEAFQVWNEPNNPSFPENATLKVLTSPENYVELLALAHNTIRTAAPRKVIVNGATTAIAQNFPSTLNYNKEMIKAGALSFVDIFAIHYYGKQPERVLVPGGIGEFLRGIPKPLWVTESGAQGISNQREYAERIFPFLKEQIPNLRRIYLYQFTEATPATSTYGLRNLTPGLTLSDLYVTLRDRGRTRPQKRFADR